MIMQVEVVRRLSALHQLQADWTRVYAADPEAQFFLSWPWMSKRLARRSDWGVLVARPSADAPPVAFFPIRPVTRIDDDGLTYKDVTMAGRGAADYTGFICQPEHEEAVGRAFAAHLLRREWRVLSLECLRATPQRMRGLIDALADAGLEFERESMVMTSGVDNAICPYADLPDDWDRYLAQLSANTRQRLRRLLRTVDGTTIRITHADAATIDRDIEILLSMWSARWASQKGRHLAGIISSSREELLDALANGTLLLPILWRGDTPVAANACMIDREKRELLFQLGARDPAAEDLSPGMLLHAHTIRTAIAQGFQRYDFMRGNEPYKYSFATAERQIVSIEVRRPTPETCSARAPAWYALYRANFDEHEMTHEFDCRPM
jgi:CelD/BcsL family acetyltransferase involved in cellulose biosynthesis